MKLIIYIYIFKDGQRTIALLSASIHKLAVYGWQLKPFLDTQVAAVHLPWGATTSTWESSRMRIFRSTWESDRLSWGLPRFFLSDWTLGHNKVSDGDQAIKREIKLLNEQLRLVNINSPGVQSGWIWGGRTGSLFPQKVKAKKVCILSVSTKNSYTVLIFMTDRSNTWSQVYTVPSVGRRE